MWTLVRLDARVFAALMVWTAAVVFLPFPTALVAENGGPRATKALSIGATAVGVIAITGLELLMDRAPALTDGVGAPDLAASLISTGLTLSALVLALSFPILGYYPMLLLSLDRRVRARGQAPEPGAGRGGAGAVSPGLVPVRPCARPSPVWTAC